MKKIIPEAYKIIYRGWPCEKKDKKFDTLSFSVILKFVSVAGKSNIAEAKIAGITPAVFIFKGRWEESPPYILLPICLLG